MPWPSKITGAFATIQEGAGITTILEENQKYCGPYNKLLHTLFPADSDFIVSPNYITSTVDGDSNLVVLFEITFRQRPVLILELKPPQHLSQLSRRKIADRQLRERLADMKGIVVADHPLMILFLISSLQGHAPLPILYGVSAIGTKLCFYEFDRERMLITPNRIPSDPKLVTDVAPRERWNCDVLEADGEQRLRELAAHVTNLCKQLGA